MNRLFYYSCLECTYKTKLLFKAKNHKEFHKNPSKKPFDCSVPLTKNIDQYKCYKCPQNFQTPLLSQLNCHITQNHTLQNFNPQIYKCQKCHFKSFSRYLTLRHKIIDKHSTLTQIKREEVCFHCEICDFRVKRKSILRRHMIRKHTSESEINWYTCEKCPFRAKFRSDLNRHKLVHSSQTLFHCNDCSFGTKRKSNLTEHIANVHDKPWLQCDKCAYKTKNMGLLVVHVRSEHDDDYKGWLRCPLCPYKCKLEEQLHAHQAGMHALVESVRHYKCPQCSYKASAQSAVKSHVKAVHSSNFFNCEHCEFRSKYKRNFLRHVLVKHTPPDKIQWVKCNQCEYKAKCKGKFLFNKKICINKLSIVHFNYYSQRITKKNLKLQFETTSFPFPTEIFPKIKCI